jgi:putative endonuclease
MTSGLGAFGENYAVGRLGRLGYQILERNVRFRSGEIDIVAREGSDLVFVEVKCRRSSRFGSPESSITRSRFGRLSNAIGEYLSRDEQAEQSFRVDVVAIELDALGRVKRCEVLKGVAPPPE